MLEDSRDNVEAFALLWRAGRETSCPLKFQISGRQDWRFRAQFGMILIQFLIGLRRRAINQGNGLGRS